MPDRPAPSSAASPGFPGLPGSRFPARPRIGLPDGFRSFAFAFLALVLLMAAVGSARADKADRDKPINVESDRLEYDDVKQISTFTGNVILTKGTIEIRADKLTVHTDADGWQYGSAWGNPATFRQKREGIDEWIDGEALQIDYNGKDQTFHLQRKAMVERSDGKRVLDEIHGDDIVYDSATEHFTAQGATAGRGATTGNPSGRVRVVIQPRTPEAQTPGAPTSLKPDPALGPALVPPAPSGSGSGSPGSARSAPGAR